MSGCWQVVCGKNYSIGCLKASFRSAIYGSSFLAAFVPVFELSLGVHAIACPDVVQKCLERERRVLATFLMRMMPLGICSRVCLGLFLTIALFIH